MLTRRTLLATSAAALLPGTVCAATATPKDVLVMGKALDDMIALDPAQAYEFTGNELNGNLYRAPGSGGPDNLVDVPGNIGGRSPDAHALWETGARATALF